MTGSTRPRRKTTGTGPAALRQNPASDTRTTPSEKVHLPARMAARASWESAKLSAVWHVVPILQQGNGGPARQTMHVTLPDNHSNAGVPEEPIPSTTNRCKPHGILAIHTRFRWASANQIHAPNNSLPSKPKPSKSHSEKKKRVSTTGGDTTYSEYTGAPNRPIP
jgi:hypothetical protein